MFNISIGCLCTSGEIPHSRTALRLSYLSGGVIDVYALITNKLSQYS